MAVSPPAAQPAASPGAAVAPAAPREADEEGSVMDRHPLHAFYLGRSQGEVGTFPARARAPRHPVLRRAVAAAPPWARRRSGR